MFKNKPGEGPDIFVMPDGTRFANIICWENLFAPFVRDLTLRGARLIVQLTNDNWFGLTSLPFHHTRASIFRAVENRIPVVVANNAGPSLIVDSQGRTVAGPTGLFKTGIIVQEVKIRNGQSFYTRVGDLFALLAVSFSVLVLCYLIAERRASKYRNHKMERIAINP
jgi:apolipoprotein N-acyltransferase